MSSRQTSGRANSGAAPDGYPLFVVSMWRSGSSLLYALLNKHPQVGLMYEADLSLIRTVFLKPKGWRHWARRWQFWNEALTRHGLRAEDFPDTDSTFAQAFALAHQRFAQAKNATIWGDKSPNYYDHLRFIADAFPNARFIIVWRDPAGTANSVLRAAKSGNSYFRRRGSLLRALIRYEVFKQQCNWLHNNGRLVFEVNYEELVVNPAETMQAVCKFLDISYDESLSSLAGADRSAIYSGEHHGLVRGNEIVSKARPNVVPGYWLEKINRYVLWWKRQYTGWPQYPQLVSDAKFPGILERLWDRMLYRCLRAYDSFTAFCFAFAPIRLLRAYRNQKYKKADPAPQPALHSLAETPNAQTQR